ITAGERGATGSGAQSTACAASINILNGLITADELVANVMSSVIQDGAFSNADGSTFTSLVVAGVPITSGDASVAPNTSTTLPGVGPLLRTEPLPSADRRLGR